MRKLILMISTIILMSSCNDGPKVEYSYFTYFGNTLYECSKYYHDYTLMDCVSINGTKLDVVYNATYIKRKR